MASSTVSRRARAEQPREASLLSDLLEALGYAGKRVAVELNGQIVPKSRYGSVRLRADDCVEVVVAVGGG